jgi:NifU-like protein involved in Fe-S cluster formation
MPYETNFPSIYNQRILELAANIPRQGRLAAPGATAKAHSKLCGSTVIVDLVMADGRVVDFAQEVKACALGQAAASIMARNVIGSTGPELRALREEVRAMLKANGPPPQGKWADIAVLEPVRGFKARHASTLLTFEATVDCINQIEALACNEVTDRIPPGVDQNHSRQRNGRQ